MLASVPIAVDFVVMECHDHDLPVDSDQNTALEGLKCIALTRLARYSSTSEAGIRQSFLFSTDRLCGVRFEAGIFQASWNFTDHAIEITRDQKVIERVATKTCSEKAA